MRKLSLVISPPRLQSNLVRPGFISLLTKKEAQGDERLERRTSHDSTAVTRSLQDGSHQDLSARCP